MGDFAEADAYRPGRDGWTAEPFEPCAPRWDDDPADAAPAALVRHLTALRDTVTDHASARRDAGAPIDRTIAELRALVEHAEHLEGQPDELGVLLGQVRLWTVAAYAEEPGLRNVPRFY